MSASKPDSCESRLRACCAELYRRILNGEDCRAEAFLDLYPAIAADLESALDLVYHEYLARCERGVPPEADEYFARFPQWREAIFHQLQVHSLLSDDAPLRPRDKSTLRPEATAQPWRTNPENFEILNEIGRGKMGVVYRAWQKNVRRVVALKVILARSLSSADELARFRQEATAIGRLVHPNIVQIFGLKEWEECPFLVLEHVDGGSLAKHWAGVPQPAARVAGLVHTLAGALQYAHEQGVVHRDLRPGNVLLTREGAPKIIDFGLAKLTAAEEVLTLLGQVLGTPSYMAPEQAAGQSAEVSPAADVYSLGAVLYEGLTGQPPFRGETVMETLRQVLEEEPVPPRRIQPGVPRDLEAICLKCLSKEPARRYESAQALADDVQRYLSGQPIQGRRVSPAVRMAMWCRRKPSLVATVVVAVLAVATAAGVGLFQVLEERERLRLERDVAQEHLYRALVGEARATLHARHTGWHWTAMDHIRQARSLTGAQRDPAELRELVIECIGSVHPCMRLRQTCSTHRGPITHVALSADGGLAASASHDKTIYLWRVPAHDEIPDDTPVAELAGHGEVVTGVAFHPKGGWLASGSADGTVRLWSVAGVQRAAQIPERVSAARVLPMGAGPVHAVEFSPDGGFLLAACRDHTIRVIPINKQGDAVEADQRVLSGHTDAVTCLAVSCFGVLASGSSDRTIRFWDLTSNRELDKRPTLNAPNTLAFHPDGAGFAWGEPEIYGFNLGSLETEVVDGFGNLLSKAVQQVRFDADGRLVTAARDGSVRLWSRRGKSLKDVAVATGSWGAATSAAIGPTGKWVVAGYADGGVRFWQLSEPAERWYETRGSVQKAAFVGDQPLLATYKHLHNLSGGWHGPRTGYGPAPITALTVHPAGGAFAYGCASGALRIGNLEQPNETTVCKGHARRIVAVTASADGKQVASASLDGTVKLWDWRTGECKTTLEPNLGPLNGIGWGPDDATLAVSGQRGVAVCDLHDPSRFRLIRQHSVLVGSLAVYGDLLACSGPQATIELCELSTGHVRRTLRGHKNTVTALAFSPDGSLLASAAGNDMVRLWDTKTGAKRGGVPVGNAPGTGTWLAFDPNGDYLAGSSASSTLILGLRGDGLVPVAQCGPTLCGRFSPDGTALCAANGDSGALSRWAVADFKLASAKNVKASAPPFGSLPSATEVVPGGHSPSYSVWGLATSPDGRWIVTGGADRTVKLWDVSARKLARTLKGHDGLVWSLAVSADSKYVASGDETPGGGVIKVWDIASGREIHHFQAHTSIVRGLAFHPSRPWLASCSDDGAVCLWDLEAGKRLGVLHRFDLPVHQVAFRPDGRWLAAACHNRCVALWELTDTFGVPTAPTRGLEGHTSDVRTVGFSADGRYLASGADMGVIILWDAQTFKKITTLRSGTTEIRGLSFSHDGRFLAGAAYVGPTVVWDLVRLRRTLAELDLDW